LEIKIIMFYFVFQSTFNDMNNLTSSADDLKTIRKIMEESSRFLSLSGLSGIFVGCFAIAGALIAWFIFLQKGSVQYIEYFSNQEAKSAILPGWPLVADAIFVLVLSVIFSLILSARKARKSGKSAWTPISKRLLVNLLIPLVSGGLFVTILLMKNGIHFVIPCLLIFYGLALVNAGRLTYSEVFYLGLLEVLTGLVAAFFPAQGIWFWIFGFGILHIVYGTIMYRKYEA
jgi:hypothetical protein